MSSNAAGKRKASNAFETSPEPEDIPFVANGPSKQKRQATDEPKPALVGRKAPRDWKKQDGFREPAPALKPSGMYYDSLDEALSKMSPPDWMSPADDNVPRTSAELAPYVVQLTTAMKDMSDYRDETKR